MVHHTLLCTKTTHKTTLHVTLCLTLNSLFAELYKIHPIPIKWVGKQDLIALANAPEEDNIVFHVSLRSTMVAIVRLRCITSTIHHHPVQIFTFKCNIFTSIIVIHHVGEWRYVRRSG